MTMDEVTELNLKDHYSLVPDPNNIDADYWCVKIEKGDYRGLIYKYGDIRIDRNINGDGTLPVSFAWEIMFVPPDIMKKQISDAEHKTLETFLGNIMMEMIQENLESERTGSETIGEGEDKKIIIKRRIATDGDPFKKSAR